MSDKKVSFNEVLMIIGAVFIAAMFFIPLPAEVLDVFARIEFVLASAILIYSLTRYFQLMPRLVLIYSGFAVGLNLSLCSLMLSGLRKGITESQLSFMSEKINGGLFINMLFLVLFIATIIFLSVGTKRVVEKAVRFALDTMTQKLFDIDSQHIDLDDAKLLKGEIRTKIDFYSCMDGSVKFLAGTVKASLFMVLIEFAGGTLIEKYRNGKSMLESINNAVTLTKENVKLFLPSLVLVTIAIGFKITKQSREES